MWNKKINERWTKGHWRKCSLVKSEGRINISGCGILYIYKRNINMEIRKRIAVKYYAVHIDEIMSIVQGNIAPATRKELNNGENLL